MTYFIPTNSSSSNPPLTGNLGGQHHTHLSSTMHPATSTSSQNVVIDAHPYHGSFSQRTSNRSIISHPDSSYMQQVNVPFHSMIGSGSSSTAALTGVPTKGLRQFSLRVCKKVEEKGITTYNEVADELVADLGCELGKGDQKNIRRRVYDALNVLMAMDIIRKDKKEIAWLGLPNDMLQDIDGGEQERLQMYSKLEQKKKGLYDLTSRYIMMKNLIQRNRSREEKLNSSGEASQSYVSSQQDILPLPFVLINAAPECRINCEMLEDRSHYYFEFDSPFLIHEDTEVLRLMGLNNTTGNSSNGGNILKPHLVNSSSTPTVSTPMGSGDLRGNGGMSVSMLMQNDYGDGISTDFQMQHATLAAVETTASSTVRPVTSLNIVNNGVSDVDNGYNPWQHSESHPQYTYNNYEILQSQGYLMNGQLLNSSHPSYGLADPLLPSVYQDEQIQHQSLSSSRLHRQSTGIKPSLT